MHAIGPAREQFDAAVAVQVPCLNGEIIFANVLIGGSNKTLTLQPLSVQARTGLSVAAGVSEFALRLAG